ncbi:MAG: glycoside hydrolase family 32 protein [Caldilineaceae bacterium]|nr:glycoside hydrolase family 32 protein [Caldilineaceae bacterium]
MAAQAAAAARTRLSRDPHRPLFHFLPPANWMNDPNGLIEWEGRVHLFYQYNPHGPFQGTIHWGHAVSSDLVHWEDWPIALAPTPGGPDAEGCWSGCAVDNGGVPTLIYTGIQPQTVCVATGDAELAGWEKPAYNPVIGGPPAWLRESCGGDFRDPFVWREGDHWNMMIASRIEGEGGVILLYRSMDLARWQLAGTLLKGDMHQAEPLWPGTIWECPNLLEFGDKQALIISAQAPEQGLMYAFYQVGRLRGESFDAGPPRILVHGVAGENFYAPQATRLADGRYLLFGWLTEGRRPDRCLEAGWAGVMSLPLIVSLWPDGALALEPHGALQSLRRQHWHFEHVELASGAEQLLQGVQGDCLEIIARFEGGSLGEYGLKLRCSPDGSEYTQVSVFGDESRLALGRARSSLDPETYREPCVARLERAPGAPVTLHIFLDRSVVEIFAGAGRTAMAGRIYPTLADSLGVALFSHGGAAVLESLDIWTLAPIWPHGGR